MDKIDFITTAYGSRSLPFLPALLYSIRETHPTSTVTLLWQDLVQSKLMPIIKSFPQLIPIETNLNFTSSLAARISSKTLLWNQAIKSASGKNLIFIDNDTLVLKNLNWLVKLPADLIFTRTGGFFPINTGVVYCKNSPPVREFFSAWTDKTRSIINNPELFAQVNDKYQPYGGADQMAVIQLLGLRSDTDRYCYPAKSGRLLVQLMPCQLLNETRSVPLTPDTHIVHYKGGWRYILFYGEDFTPNRPKAASWSMYMTYLKTYSSAVRHINAQTGSHFSLSDFGIHIPFYVNQHSWEEYPIVYRLFKLASPFRHYFRVGQNFMSRRDLNY